MGKRTLHGMFIPTCPMLRAFYRTSNLSPDGLALLALCVTQTYPECKPDNVHPGLNDYADDFFWGTNLSSQLPSILTILGDHQFQEKERLNKAPIRRTMEIPQEI